MWTLARCPSGFVREKSSIEYECFFSHCTQCLCLYVSPSVNSSWSGRAFEGPRVTLCIDTIWGSKLPAEACDIWNQTSEFLAQRLSDLPLSDSHSTGSSGNPWTLSLPDLPNYSQTFLIGDILVGWNIVIVTFYGVRFYGNNQWCSN